VDQCVELRPVQAAVVAVAVALEVVDADRASAAAVSYRAESVRRRHVVAPSIIGQAGTA
jgi:4-hydroxyphenylpyruvate dioxygenase-like putative hemolysin